MPEPAASILDAHVHLWDTRRFELAWLSNVPRLAARYSADDLGVAMGDVPVTGAVAVQAGESAAEAEWLTDISAGSHRLPSHVVLQYTPAAGAWLGTVQAAVDRSGMLPAGVRLPVHRRSADWTGLEGFAPLATRLEEEGIVLELLLRPDQIAVVRDLAVRHPRLQIVLCHLGLGSHEPTIQWRAALADLAGSSNVSAKISGLFARQGTPSEVDAGVRSAVAAAMETIGADRLMFGSDWPMSTLVGDYAEIVDRTAGTLRDLTADESSAVWRRTAERIYAPAARRPTA
jgi:L-fuconolactonase